VAFLQEYSPHVFVSYSHIDNEPEFGRSWVTEFHNNLVQRIQVCVGATVSVWRDGKLGGSDVFSQEIEKQVRGSAVLVSIVSPGYVHSEWCRRELETFLEAAAARGGVHLGTKRRIVKVVKTPVKVGEVPEMLQELNGHVFFREERDTGRFREFLLDAGGEARQKYEAAIDDIAQEVKTIFELLESGASAAPTPATGGVPIFLAHTSSDLYDKRLFLKRELQARGYRILPRRDEMPPPDERGLEALRADLEQCKLSVHLLGSRYGVIPEGMERSIVELQYTIAEEHRDSTLTRIVWIPPDLTRVEERQLKFLKSVRNYEVGGGAVEVLENSIEDLKTFLNDRLNPKPVAPKGKTPATSDAGAEGSEDGHQPLRVYLIHDPRDSDAIQPLQNYLFDHGIQVYFPTFEGDPDQIREDHKENLLVSDVVLIWWGAANAAWVNSKTRDFAKLKAWGRTSRFRAKAVLIANPPNPQKNTFRCIEAEVIQLPENFSAEVLTPVLGKLENGAHG
jgi:hypothetical protein